MRRTRTTIRYEELLKQRFPGVRVFSGIPGPEDLPVYDVFCVPDSQMSEFEDYCYDIQQTIGPEQGLPRVLLLPHTVSATEEFYPDALSSGRGKRRVVTRNDAHTKTTARRAKSGRH